MRRKEKAVVDRKTIDGIIQKAEICHLSCCLDDQPYLIPISFGYDGQAIFIHTASAGKKITIFERNPRVCVSFVSQADLLSNQDQACNWSFNYSSVIAEGKISEITDPALKTSALNHIMSHYSGREWEIPNKSLSSTRAWKIMLENPSGKTSPPPKK